MCKVSKDVWIECTKCLYSISFPWSSNYIMECGLLRLKLWTAVSHAGAGVCCVARIWRYVDPKWRQCHHLRKRYPPTPAAPIRTLVSFPERFRPQRPHNEVKGRSKTARMGWHWGLSRDKIWYFDGIRLPKQACRYTNGLLKVRSLRWRWISYAVNAFLWIF